MVRLTAFLDPKDILLGVQAKDKRRLFDIVGSHMERVHGIPADAVATALQRRESVGTTALGHGVAIPHARVKGLEEIRMVYLRLAPALAFDTPDALPVTDVVVLLVPAPATQIHLDLLSQVASLFSEEGFRVALQRRQDARQIRQTFADWTR